MDLRYAAVMGYTEKELKAAFADHIQDIVKKRKEQWSIVAEKEILKEVRTLYDGYRVPKSDTCFYNPFSTLNYMDEQEVSSYWYSTGTPSFLINQIPKGKSCFKKHTFRYQ